MLYTRSLLDLNNTLFQRGGQHLERLGWEVVRPAWWRPTPPLRCAPMW